MPYTPDPIGSGPSKKYAIWGMCHRLGGWQALYSLRNGAGVAHLSSSAPLKKGGRGEKVRCPVGFVGTSCAGGMRGRAGRGRGVCSGSVPWEKRQDSLHE